MIRFNNLKVEIHCTNGLTEKASTFLFFPLPIYTKVTKEVVTEERGHMQDSSIKMLYLLFGKTFDQGVHTFADKMLYRD